MVIVAPPMALIIATTLTGFMPSLAIHTSARNVAESPDWPEPSPAAQAWLGSAVAIKEPTAAVFLRQNGSNLLIVGHREEAALGVMASGFVSVAAQLAQTVDVLS